MRYLLAATFSVLAISSTHALNIPNPTLDKYEVVKSIVLTTPTDLDDSSDWWYKFATTLTSSDSGIVPITLRVTGNGGDITTANRTIRAIEDYKSRGGIVNMTVIGPTISAHAFLLCYASNLKFEPYTTATFHGTGVYVSHLFGLITYRSRTDAVEGVVEEQKSLEDCVKVGLLTSADVKSIVTGHRIVLISDRDGNIKKLVLDDFDTGTVNILRYTLDILIYLLVFVVLAWLFRYIVLED